MKQLRLFLSVLILMLMFVPVHAQKKASDVGIDTAFYYRITSVSESTPDDPRHITVLGQDHKLVLAQTIQDPGQLWKIDDVSVQYRNTFDGSPSVRFTNRLVKDKSLDIDTKSLDPRKAFQPLRLVLEKTIKDASLKHAKANFRLIQAQSWAVVPNPTPGQEGQFILANFDGIGLQAFKNEDVDKRLVVGMAPGANDKSHFWVLSKTNIPIDQEFELTSTSFEDGGKIPDKYAGEDGISPPLAWKNAPAGTKSFAIICLDPDAATPADPNPFIHWFILNIPADTKFLMAGIPQLEQVSTPFGAVQAPNSDDEIGYSGPMPPKGGGKHRYIFTLIAMDRVHVLDPKLSQDEFVKILDSSTLAKTELMGTYEVPASSFQDRRLVLRSSEPLTMVLEMALRAAQSSTVSGLRH